MYMKTRRSDEPGLLLIYIYIYIYISKDAEERRARTFIDLKTTKTRNTTQIIKICRKIKSRVNINMSKNQVAHVEICRESIYVDF